MKSKVKTRIASTLGVIALIAVIGFSMSVLSLTGCDNPTDGGINGNSGGGGTAVTNIAAIPGVTFPVAGETPVAAITETAQYTGTVEWNGNPSAFVAGTVYTATITLTAKEGFTLKGVKANFFTVAGATASNNAADSGVVTAVFPETLAASVGISLDKTGVFTFETENTKLYMPTPETVTITNTSDKETGVLTVVLSGDDPDSFLAAPKTINSIAVGGTGSFYICPNTNLDYGTYTATVTVSGGSDFIASFIVSFTINDPSVPTLSFALSQNGTYKFASQLADYDEQTPLDVTVTNTGNLPTGALTVALSGTDPESFALSTASINSIAVNETGGFTVVPKTGLALGTYTATVTVTGGGISASFAVTFTVAAGYSISLSQTGEYFFLANTGYNVADLTPLEVTITNTGIEDTGNLTAALSGYFPSYFKLSKTSVDSIEVGGTDTFTIVPNRADLSAGYYLATVTVTGAKGIKASFNVSFSVTPASNGITLSQTGTYKFPDAITQSVEAASLEVTVTNTSNEATGDLTIALSGPDEVKFTLSTTTISSIAAGGSATFTVSLNTSRLNQENSGWTYKATVSVTGDNNISAGFNVGLTTMSYGISLNPSTAIYTFPEAIPGYGEQNPYLVTITNSSSGLPTGDLTIALSGTDADKFTLSTTTISSIAVGGTGTFTVVPKTGLALNAYNTPYQATVNVTGIHKALTKSFNVRFAVAKYVLTMTNSDYTFPEVTVGYNVYSSVPVNPINISEDGSNMPQTISYALSGANADSFYLDTTRTPRTVRPYNGLALGTYTATVTVSSDKGLSASFNISFTVAEPRYSISLSQTDYTFPDAIAGYGNGSTTPLTVTVTNTGNLATGNITVAKSGTNSGSFYLSTSSISISATKGTATFDVSPNNGLAAGTYTATVTVSVNNGNSESFNISFTVTSGPTYKISLSQTGTYTFPVAPAGYSAQTPLEVTVTNTGTGATGALNVALSGTSASSFTLSKTSINSIANGATDTFTVTPKPGLAVGLYLANVAVSGGNSIYTSFNMEFRVNTYDFTLSQTGTYTFPVASIGYSAQTPLTVTVTNKGTMATGVLSAALSGADANRFSLSGTSISSIANENGTATFTVVPNTGIGTAGTYTATVTVTGNGISRTFNLSFTVFNAVDPYVITGSGSSFTAVRSGTTIASNQPIQTVINAISDNAAKTACTIQFGNGSNVLDIGSGYINFSGSNWGAITLTGKITSSYYGSSSNGTGTIIIDTASVSSRADIANTNTDPNSTTLLNKGTGTVTITNGTISSDNGNVIINDSTGTVTISGAIVTDVKVEARGSNSTRSAISNGSGTVNISGGTVVAAYGRAVSNGSGPVNISGGDVYSLGPSGVAVYSSGTGKITVSGTADVYSRNTSASSGTIVLSNSGNATTERLVISGGTVSSYSGANARAIYNDSTGAVTVSGGSVETTEGRAIHNNSTGAVNISSGTVKATTGIAVYNANTGKITVSGGKVTSANNTASQGTISIANSGTATTERLVISGGTVENTVSTLPANTAAIAVYNASTGAVTISGGTVQSKAGNAVLSDSLGKITVSGSSTKVTSANTSVVNSSTRPGTISIASASGGTADTVRLEITGGTVENTSTGTGSTVYNSSANAVNISGGTISGGNSATGSQTVYNVSTGKINVSGGTVSATTGSAIASVDGGNITVSGTANITSANVGNLGTVYIASSVASTGVYLAITGGTITNTATNGYAIYNNNGAERVTISGSPTITGRKFGCP